MLASHGAPLNWSAPRPSGGSQKDDGELELPSDGSGLDVG